MKSKFNIIDAVILIIIVAVVVAGVFAYFKLSDKDVAVNDVTKINFVVEVNNLTETGVESFKSTVGKAVTFGATSSGSGVIKNIEITPFIRWTQNREDGEYIKTEVPGRFTVNVTIESSVQKSDTAFVSGSETVTVGKKMPFNSKGAAFEEGYIVNMYEVK